MLSENQRTKVVDLLLDAAERARELAGRIRKTSANGYTDQFHKRVTSEAGALNIQQNSAGKLVVAEATFLDVNAIAAKTTKAIPAELT